MEKHFKYLFSIVIFLMILIGCSSIYFLINTYITTKDMYEHPYKVSNKLKEVELSIYTIHLASFSSDEGDIKEISRKDSLNRERLHTILKLYLGNQADVKRVIALYEQWLSKRIYSSDKNEQQLFEKLLQAIAVVSDYADKKADELYKDANNDARNYSAYIGAALLFATILSTILLFRTLRHLRETTENRKQYLHLIDQNVMITAIDNEGVIFDISNKLCRYLSKTKKQVIERSLQDIFFKDNEILFLEMWQQVKSGAKWHGEIEIIKGNEPKWLGIDVLPMQDSDFSQSGYRLLAHDITSRKSLEKISITDSLTGLLNRRTLDESLERTSRLACRNKEPLTIAIFDIDYFKQYNDTYGHVAGDKVLTRIAALISKMLARPNDYVFRIGGEEFCMIFNSKSAEQSQLYLENIQHAVNDLMITHENSSTSNYVTISIGAIFYEGQEHIEGKMLLLHADNNLYIAKEKRNHTVQTEYAFKH